MRVLILGDSHLARAVRSHGLVATGTTSRAVGGSVATDLPGQLEGVTVSAYDTVVVSVGTNDAGWRQVPLPEFTEAMEAFLRLVEGTRVLLVTSPGSDPLRAPAYSPALMASYADAAARLVKGAGGSVMDTPALLAPLGADAFLEDGFHLTPAAYALLLPAIAEAVRG